MRQYLIRLSNQAAGELASELVIVNNGDDTNEILRLAAKKFVEENWFIPVEGDSISIECFP